MLIACWSAKGGSGTTVVAAALSLLLARRAPAGAVAADLAGDLAAALGVAEPQGPGLGEWTAADAGADALDRLAVEVAPALRLLHRGREPLGGDSLTAGLARLAAGGTPVVADCGTLHGTSVAVDVAASATVSLLVTRPCYLAVRRALAAPLLPSAVILVDEPGRSLGASDVAEVLGVPVRAVVPVDQSIARAVDAGLLSTRVPRPLARALRHAA